MAAESHLSLYADCAAETERIGEELGRRLKPGTLVLLFGNLGAGKTTLSRGLARGLEVVTPIQSPTFALIYEHQGRIPLAHMDFYRLNMPEEVDNLGLDEYLESGSVVLIEWPEIVLDRLPDERIEVRLTLESDGRCIDIVGYDEAASVVMEWSATLEAKADV